MPYCMTTNHSTCWELKLFEALFANKWSRLVCINKNAKVLAMAQKQ